MILMKYKVFPEFDSVYALYKVLDPLDFDVGLDFKGTLIPKPPWQKYIQPWHLDSTPKFIENTRNGDILRYSSTFFLAIFVS